MDAPSIAVVYLARGAEPGWEKAFGDFLQSYRRHAAGCEHRLHVLLKGFRSTKDEHGARALFGSVAAQVATVPDVGFDLGSYIGWARTATEAEVCFLNTFAELRSGDWLLKLAANLRRPGVGMVGATGSFESLKSYDESFDPFPNIHLRSNGMMLGRKRFLGLTQDAKLRDKRDALRLESGPQGLSARLRAEGLELLVVGANGRGYAPRWWPHSDTFRMGRQENLLVSDNQTRMFETMVWADKRQFAARTWGPHLQPDTPLR